MVSANCEAIRDHRAGVFANNCLTYGLFIVAHASGEEGIPPAHARIGGSACRSERMDDTQHQGLRLRNGRERALPQGGACAGYQPPNAERGAESLFRTAYTNCRRPLLFR